MQVIGKESERSQLFWKPSHVQALAQAFVLELLSGLIVPRSLMPFMSTKMVTLQSISTEGAQELLDALVALTYPDTITDGAGFCCVSVIYCSTCHR